MLISFFIIYKIFKVGQVREGYLLQCRWEIFKGENFYNEVITLSIELFGTGFGKSIASTAGLDWYSKTPQNFPVD